MPYIIGLNSGSSFDGVDVVLCEISLAADGHPTRPKYIDALTLDWPEALRDPIQKAFNNDLTIFEMTRVNYAAGALFAQAVKMLLRKTSLDAEDIEVIGYDGQTIYQEPPDRLAMAQLPSDSCESLVDLWLTGGYPCGYYIVESGVVAGLTNITTVTQFRPTDHSLGGSGAPLMQYLDFVAFRNESTAVVTLNVGGISNVQLVCGKDRSKMMAFDCGPGNVMIDHVVKARTGDSYDKDGQLASSGTVIDELLQQLLGHEFFSRKPPRSAWRLDFGAEYAERVLKQYSKSSTHDLLATLTAFTAAAIDSSIGDFILPRAALTRVIMSGGGAKNLFLLELLKDRFSKRGLELVVSDEVGLPATYKEAIKFATLAYAAKNGLANNIPAASGASGFAVLGKLTLAPRVAKGTRPLLNEGVGMNGN
ncbi:hypothetical protein B0A50_03442 [Salinomyces thailandicus]|uniref:Anhydro-N-acetylmuramic acid kinase n=1 Tax=Salinomyces thailandicus TaxID=706561 RepID=A0A4U0U337_9PEZI|nr:hypothetical protein B0A50_03442 [Salinomyces thailandica]